MTQSIQPIYIALFDLCKSLTLIFLSKVKKNVNNQKEKIRFRLPWDHHNTLVGWLFEIILSVSIFPNYFMMNTPFLSFFTSICEYHRAFYQMFGAQIDRVDQFAREKRQRDDIKTALFKVISIHVSAKR